MKTKKMEITGDIKEKVFAQYWGQEVALTDGSKLIVDYVQIAICDKLILKPLSEITHEDAVGVYKAIKYNLKSSKFIFQNLQALPFNEATIAYQYLISKGYDLPNHLLDGKTLKECGLAIYE